MKTTTYPQLTTDTNKHLSDVLTPEGFTVEMIAPDCQSVNPHIVIAKGDVKIWVGLPNPNSNKNRITASSYMRLDKPMVNLRDHLSWNFRDGENTGSLAEFTLSPTSSAKRLLKRFNQAVEDYAPAFQNALENYKESVQRANDKEAAKLELIDVISYPNYAKLDKKEYIAKSNDFNLDYGDGYDAKLRISSADSMTLEISRLSKAKTLKLAEFLKTL